LVVAKSGGDFTTINDALNSITDASDTNGYLVKVMPGVYTEQVTMKQHVDIEGSGELVTKSRRGQRGVVHGHGGGGQQRRTALPDCGEHGREQFCHSHL
jgi:hypothetical protein